MSYQEYPRHLHKPGGAHVVVQDDAERDAKLAEGWKLTPAECLTPEPAPEAEAPAAPDPVAAALTGARQQGEAPRKPGRPKKARSGDGDDPTDRV